MAAAKIDANQTGPLRRRSTPRRHVEKLCVLAISAPTCPSTLLLIKLRRHAGNRDEFISPPIVPPFPDNFTFHDRTSNLLARDSFDRFMFKIHFRCICIRCMIFGPRPSRDRSQNSSPILRLDSPTDQYKPVPRFVEKSRSRRNSNRIDSGVSFA